MAKSEGKTLTRSSSKTPTTPLQKPSKAPKTTPEPKPVAEATPVPAISGVHKSRARTIHAALRNPPAKTETEKPAQVKAVKAKASPKPKAPTKSATPKAETKPQPAPAAKPDVRPEPLSPVTPEAVDALEHLSRNLTMAAMTAQSALAATLFKPFDSNESATSNDPFQVAPAMTSVMNSLSAHPEKLIAAQTELVNGYMNLWSDITRKSLGMETVPQPKKAYDRRFADPAWEQNLVFDTMRRSYLLSSEWMNKLISLAPDVDPLEKRRVEFFTKLMTDAFSPSNFLMTNPLALKHLMETNGESLAKGMQQFAEDLARGDGKLKISQADTSAFEVGKNIATTPGKVVFRNRFFELIQYTPTTEKVHETPLLIFPPWINKYYILDLQPKNSLIKWLVDQGFSVFVTSWVNPDTSMKDCTLEAYMFGGIYEAVKQVKAQTGADSVNAVGYCIAGTLLGSTLAHMKAKGDESIKSATFFTAQHDFSEAGDLMLFTNEAWLKELERQMEAAGGVLPGSAMADTFNALRANDLVWSYFVSNYLMGKAPPAFDLLYWNSDTTRMPQALHLTYLRRFYMENALSKGELELDGVKIDLKSVTIPIFEQAGREDHIAPANSVYKGAKLFGGPVTYTLAGSGHIAGVVNAPAANKYQHWIQEGEPKPLPASLNEWSATAVEHAGSWWPYWAKWLGEKSGKTVPARDPAKGKLEVLGDAPGTYVKVRS